MMSQIVKSIIILTLISICIGGIYYFFSPSYINFLKAAVLAASIQILFFFIYNNILRYIARLNLEKESLQLAQLAEQNTILAECQGCKVMNNVYVDLTKDNEFKCDNCGALNKLIINIDTVMPTKPIYDK